MHYDPSEREELKAAADQTGVSHENNRDHALWHLWRAAKYYSSYEGLEAMLQIERHQHQTDIRTKRIAVLEFSKSVLDHLVDHELKEAFEELKQYFNAKEAADASSSPQQEQGSDTQGATGLRPGG